MRADRPNFGPESGARSHRANRSFATKEVPMSTSVPAAAWIKRIAEEERTRDAARIKEDEQIARKAEVVRRTGGRLIDELRAAVTRDVEAFRDEFAGDPANSSRK